MENKTQQGYFIIADISDYTSFLAPTELEHAQEIVTELLELIVARLTGLMHLSKLEGDTALVYVPEGRLARGEMLLELIETTYMAFRYQVEVMHRRTTCTCQACRGLPGLDLKFFMHYGAYRVECIAGRMELLGADVALLHRLLKNSVTEATGWRAYVLFTAATLARMGLHIADLHPQVESYEQVGEVLTYGLDLHARHAQLAATRCVMVGPSEADIAFSVDFPAPPEMVWDYINDPLKRNANQAGAGIKWRAGTRPGGRTGVGSVNQGARGKGAVLVETMLDWHPFEYFTVRVVPMPNVTTTDTYEFEAVPGGTRLHYRAKVEMQLPHFIARLFYKFMLVYVFKFPEHIEGFVSMIEQANQRVEAEAG